MTSWEDRQSAFVDRLAREGIDGLNRGTVVVVPSLTFDVRELVKIAGAVYYEERMLFTLLSLRNPGLRIVFVTSLPIDEATVDYYLRFVPSECRPRDRLSFVHLGDGGPEPLTHKLNARPHDVTRVRSLVGDLDDAYLLTFNVTAAERELSENLGIPLFGPPPELCWFGSKTGARRAARRAGVSVLHGFEDLWSIEDIDHATERIRAHSPHADAVVVKLNNGFSGQGNAIVELNGPPAPLPDHKTTFGAPTESWDSFEEKIAAEGAIVEEFVRHEPMVSPSVQVRIVPGGNLELLSTHDQVLGGPEKQVYLGCRFPADADYRMAIQQGATRIARLLAAEGVMGSFGIDFLVAGGHGGNAVYLSEINLRMGGTTHPYWMARLITDGRYDAESGDLYVGDEHRRYVATDNLKSPMLEGCSPAEVIGRVDRSGLAYDPATRCGATLHLMGALGEHGKMGATCIAPTLDEAESLATNLEHLLTAG